MTAHRLTHDDLIRECQRRGLRVTREPVPLTPEEDRAIRLLVLAAELLQAGQPEKAQHASLAAYCCPDSAWLGNFSWKCYIAALPELEEHC